MSKKYELYSTGSGLSGSRLDVVGDLTLVQKQPLAHKGRDLRFSTPVISDIIDDADVISATEKYSFRRILQDYNERNGNQLHLMMFGGKLF